MIGLVHETSLNRTHVGVSQIGVVIGWLWRCTRSTGIANLVVVVVIQM